MTKKEAQKVFTQMVKDVRPLINADTIRAVQISIHRVPESDVPADYSSVGTTFNRWCEKHFISQNDYTRVTIFPKMT